jgi:hypothetical protein
VVETEKAAPPGPAVDTLLGHQRMVTHEQQVPRRRVRHHPVVDVVAEQRSVLRIERADVQTYVAATAPVIQKMTPVM